MFSRKETYLNDKRRKLKKKLVGTVFLIGIVGGSYNVAFAEADIGTLLTQWFEKQKVESINSLEIAINKEREFQTEELKKQLQVEIESADEALQQYTAEEIEKRIQSIREYAQQLKNSIKVDNSKEREKIEAQIDNIYERAMMQLSNVKIKDNNGKGPNNKEDIVETSKDEKISSPSPGKEGEQLRVPDSSLPIDTPDPVTPAQSDVVVPSVPNEIGK